MGIDMAVILGIVFVAGGRNENGIEVEHLHPQLLQIIQFVHHALQIAAVKHPIVPDLGQLMPAGGVAHVIPGVKILPAAHVGAGIAVAEPIRENLILHRALGPFRHVEAGNDVEGMGGIGEGHGIGQGGPRAQIMDILALPGDQKSIINGGGVLHGIFRFIPVEHIVGFDPLHIRHAGGHAGQKSHLRPGVFHDAEANGYRIPHIGLRGRAEKGRFIAEYRSK